MATNTPNYNLSKFGYLELPWHDLMNANFDTLDILLAQLFGSRYTTSFVYADLSSGILTVSHGLDVDYPSAVLIWNDSRETIMPSTIKSVDSNTITVDLAAYGVISGTWNISIRS